LQSSDAVPQGFWRRAVSQECETNPGVRLADAGGADDKPAEKRDAGNGMFAKVRRVVYPGLANFAQREPAHRQMTTPDGSFAPGHMLYFELKGKNGDGKSAAEAAERFVDYIAEKSYTVKLAVRLGRSRR
jgi:hypothetical protein